MVGGPRQSLLETVDDTEQREMTTTTPTGTPGVATGLGLARYTLPDGSTVWGNDGGLHGYHTWSFHTPNASYQLTVSRLPRHRRHRVRPTAGHQTLTGPLPATTPQDHTLRL